MLTNAKLPLKFFANDTDNMGPSFLRMENVCIEAAPGSFKYDGKIFYLENFNATSSSNITQFGKTYNSYDRRYVLYEPLPPHIQRSVETARAVAKVQGYGVDGVFRLMNTSLPRINLVTGTSVIPECFYQGFNPAHLLFGLSVLFEWGLKRPDSSNHFLDDIPPVDRIAFFKCTEPHHYKSSWNWADAVLNIAMSSLNEIGLLNGNTSTRYLSPERGEKVEQMYCFETLYYTRRWGVLLADPEHLQQFQHRARVAYNNTLFRRESESSALSAATKGRCQNNTLAIKILLRGDSWFPRRMTNLKEIVELAKNKTTGKVTVESTKAAVDFPGQWQSVNDFDILITSAGSHLTNMILMENKNVGFLELGIIARDTFWQENALRLGFTSYIVSSGHKPHGGPRGKKVCSDDSVDLSFPDCNRTADGGIFCPNHDYSWSLTECDYIVNLDTFGKQLDKTMQRICQFSSSSLTAK